jgi:hypothetical protein
MSISRRKARSFSRGRIDTALPRLYRAGRSPRCDPNNFDREKDRFNDLSFKRSKNGGMSLVGFDCANQTSGSVCNHVRNRPEYQHVRYEAPVFLAI